MAILERIFEIDQMGRQEENSRQGRSCTEGTCSHTQAHRYRMCIYVLAFVAVIFSKETVPPNLGMFVRNAQ